MSSTSNSSKSAENAPKAQEQPKSDDIPHLGVLEEDDEFEEFECAGAFMTHAYDPTDDDDDRPDWDDSKTDLAHLNGAGPASANSSGNQLWEDNWDDDDIEDEFSVQLRNELAKTAKGDAAMQH